MKLNQDCIRDILLACEKLLVMNDDGTMNEISDRILCTHISNYDLATIKYTVKYLKETDLLSASIFEADMVAVLGFCIYDIKPLGHEFISNIRNDTIWNKVKDYSKKVGSTSTKSLINIAEIVVSEAIKKAMGI